MPKRNRSGEILIGPSAPSESNNPLPVSEERNVDGQARLVGGLVTSGIPASGAATYRADEVQALDAAAEALLAANPFWSLLIDAGYTWV